MNDNEMFISISTINYLPLTLSLSLCAIISMLILYYGARVDKLLLEYRDYSNDSVLFFFY